MNVFRADIAVHTVDSRLIKVPRPAVIAADAEGLLSDLNRVTGGGDLHGSNRRRCVNCYEGNVTIEIEGSKKPALTARWLTLAAIERKREDA